MRSAYDARTYADLMLLTADLPAVQHPPAVPLGDRRVEPAPPRPGRGTAGLAWQVVGSMWFAVSLLNLVIWAIVSIATTDLIYPWWIWVAGPWGAVLLIGWLSGIGRRRNG